MTKKTKEKLPVRQAQYDIVDKNLVSPTAPLLSVIQKTPSSSLTLAHRSDSSVSSTISTARWSSPPP